MALRALKFASLTAAASGFYLYGNKFLDPNDFGVVRVGRAIATTAVITYDYLTSLRSVPYGSEEYEFLKSQGVQRTAWLFQSSLLLQVFLEECSRPGWLTAYMLGMLPPTVCLSTQHPKGLI